MLHEPQHNPDSEYSRASPMIPGGTPQLATIRPGDPAIDEACDSCGHRQSSDAAGIARVLQKKVGKPEGDITHCLGVEERRHGGAVSGRVGLLGEERWRTQWDAELLVRSTRMREGHETDSEERAAKEVGGNRR